MMSMHPRRPILAYTEVLECGGTPWLGFLQAIWPFCPILLLLFAQHVGAGYQPRIRLKVL